jgi:hypothetical protein
VETFGLQEIGRIGALQGADALSQVVALARTDSTLLVLEQTPPRAAVFDSAGQWLTDVGRAGNGPGELRSPSYLGVLGNEIWIGDPRAGRLEVFSALGRPVRSHRWEIPADDFGAGAYPMALLDDGSVLAGPGRGVSGEDATHRNYWKASADGDAISLLYRQELRTDLAAGSLPSGQRLVGWHPLGESTLISAYPDGSGLVAVERPEADGPGEASFQVRVVDVDGRPQASWSVAYLPISAEGWLDDYLQYAASVQQEQLGRVLTEVLEIAETMYTERTFYPPATQVQAGLDGSIWVRREETSRDSVAWQIFAISGRQVGTASTPRDLQLLLVSLEEVWAVEADRLDVPYVVRLRVVTSGPGGGAPS